MQGPEALQHLLNIHFLAPGLSQHMLKRPAMLYFTLGPSSVAVAVAHDIPGGEWVLQVRPWYIACSNVSPHAAESAEHSLAARPQNAEL